MGLRLHLGLSAAVFLAATFGVVAGENPPVARFDHLSYRAVNAAAAEHAGPGINNPILPGYYPDPSIVRVGDDDYLINSTFAYFPGIPIFHSKDLVHWEQIGNAIDRSSQLDFSGLTTSRGVFAPDISYRDGRFYILNTCVGCKGNFLITATDPKGPWSDPQWFPEIDGIDPSMFHDDNGKSYILNNGMPEEPPQYEGHRAIWIQQYDLKAKKLVGPRKVVVDGGVDITKKPIWIEGPHLFKKDGAYYLIAAEGGTADNHSEVVFRAKSVFGPYVPYEHNPILTQRDLPADRPSPITSSGHADIFQARDGQWWSVFLATRPYTGSLYNTGRETFLLPVTWRDGWPIILPAGQPIPLHVDLPGVDTAGQRDALTRDGYGSGPARLEWLRIRNPNARSLTVYDDQHIGLAALSEPIGDVNARPSFIGLRQTAAQASFSATVAFDPERDGDRAGLVAIQNDNFHVFCGIAKVAGETKIILARRAGPADPRDGVTLASRPLQVMEKGPIALKLEIEDGRLRCRYKVGNQDEDMIPRQDVDATFLSTKMAGGFVGTLIGLYAYSPGKP